MAYCGAFLVKLIPFARDYGLRLSGVPTIPKGDGSVYRFSAVPVYKGATYISLSEEYSLVILRQKIASNNTPLESINTFLRFYYPHRGQNTHLKQCLTTGVRNSQECRE